MMKSYTAYCTNEDGEKMCMTREYETKKDFMNDLHGNGYKVSFIALTENYDEESQKYNERRIAKNRAAKIRRDSEREFNRRHAERESRIRAAIEAEEAAAEQPEETAPDFEAVKDQLFAKVEHIDAENAGAFADQTTVWRKRGEDIAHSIWFNGERLKRDTMNAWEETGISETEVFKVAMENTMATEKPRIHRNIFDIEREPLESTALLESWFTLQKLDDDKTVLVTTSDKKDNGAIAAFYPPVLAKICELFGGSGFYIAFTSVHEGMIHKLGSIDPSSIRRNVQETNRIFGPSDTLSDDVFYYDPQIKKLDIVPA